MAWELKIHTIDVKQGDCSIIEAWDRDENAYQQAHPGTNPTGIQLKRFALEREKYQAVLIDGGKTKYVKDFAFFYDYCTQKEIITLTQIIVSHFDYDHYQGIEKLLYAENFIFIKQEINNIRGVIDQFIQNYFNNQTQNITYVLQSVLLRHAISSEVIEQDPYDITLIDQTAEQAFYNRFVAYINNKLTGEKIKAINDAADKTTLNTLINRDFGFTSLLEYNQIFNDTTYINDEQIMVFLRYPRLPDYIPVTPLLDRVKIIWPGYRTRKSNVPFYAGGGFYEKEHSKLQFKIKKVPDYSFFYTNGESMPVQRKPQICYLGDELFWNQGNSYARRQAVENYDLKPYLFLIGACENVVDLGNNSLGTPTNRSSIGLLLYFNGFTYLTLGDLEDEGNEKNNETKLVNAIRGHGYNSITMLKAGHHGGKNATQNAILSLNPRAVFISCGVGEHGHPTYEVLSRLYKKNNIRHIFLTSSEPRYSIQKNEISESLIADFASKIYDFLNQEPLASRVISLLQRKLFTKIGIIESIKGSIKYSFKDQYIPDFNWQLGAIRFSLNKKKPGRKYHGSFFLTIGQFDFELVRQKSIISGNNQKLLSLDNHRNNGNYVTTVDDQGNATVIINADTQKLGTITNFVIDYNNNNSNKLFPKHLVQNEIAIKSDFEFPYQLFTNTLFGESIYSLEEKDIKYDNDTLQITKEYPAAWDWELADFNTFKLAISQLELSIEITKSENDDDDDDTTWIFKNTKISGNLISNNKQVNIPILCNFISTKNPMYWSLEVDKANLSNPRLSIKDLLNLGLSYNSYYLPENWSFFDEKIIELKQLTLDFIPNSELSANYKFGAAIPVDLVLIENVLRITNLGFYASMSNNANGMGVSCDFQIKEKTVELGIGMSTNEYWYGYIKGKTPDGKKGPLPGLTDMANWIGGFDETELGKSLKRISSGFSFDLTNVRIELNMKTKAVRFLAVDSTLSINSLHFNIATTLLPDLRVYGRLDTTTPVKIQQALSDFGLGCPFQSEMTITEASIDAYPKGGFYKINLGVGEVAKINIGGGRELDINEIDLQILSNSGDFSGYLDAILVVKPAPEVDEDDEPDEPTAFELRAAYEDAHWAFDGQLNGDIELEEFITWLTAQFGISKDSLPVWLLHLHLTHVEINFSTTGYFHFDMELYSPLSSGDAQNDETADKEERLTFHFSITKEVENSTKTFKASVDIAGEMFEIDVDKTKTSTKIDAGWSSEYSQITIAQIITALGIDEYVPLPQGIDIGFNHAEISFETSETGKKLLINASKNDEYDLTFIAAKMAQDWVYAFKTDIRKIDVNLKNLPLVGKEVKDKISVQDIHLRLLSTDLDKAKADSLTDEKGTAIFIVNDGESIGKGASLALKLKIGEKEFPVEVGTASTKAPSKSRWTARRQLQVTAAQDDKPANPVKWKKIGKKAGPLYLDKLGTRFDQGKLSLYFEASFFAGPVAIDLQELSLTSSINKIEMPGVALQGLGIAYMTDTLQIGGSFSKETPQEGVKYQYSGAALIGSKLFSLAAAGAYAELTSGDASMFMFGMLTNPPLGGPVDFYITGIAAGFGYNRDLLVPGIDEVKGFPMVAAFINQATGDQLEKAKHNPLLALESLKDYVPIRLNEQWAVFGLRFTNYKLVESLALAAIKFGTEFEIDLLGFSSLRYPKEKPLVNAELVLRATIAPREGLVAIDARLTPESYLFSSDCRLTGGFAFYTWFGAHPNAGDLVLTMGGYSPRYQKPAHYPGVPRLGFNWQVSDHLNITGRLYYALTPRCLMAGGSLEANFQSDSFKAWFSIGADFYIAWQPYHYEADMYISFGVSYTFRLNLKIKTITKTISGTFGAKLSIWGPDFSGRATVDLSIVSFTINFGKATKRSDTTISWDNFKTQFLPEIHSNPAIASAYHGNQIITDTYCTSKAVSGIIPNADDKVVLLQPENIIFEVNTLIPNKKVVAANEVIALEGCNTSFKNKLTNTLNGTEDIVLRITWDNKNLGNQVSIKYALIKANLASAQWANEGQSEETTRNLVVGLRIIPIFTPSLKYEANKKKLEFKETTPIGVQYGKDKEKENKVLLNIADIETEAIKKNSMRDALLNSGLLNKQFTSVKLDKTAQKQLRLKTDKVKEVIF